MHLAVELYKKILKGELKKFPNRFWVDSGAEENAAAITRYFIEEILKWKEEDVKKNLTELVFRKNKLSGMLEYTFNRSPFKAIDNAYPGIYKEWDFKAAPKHIWENEEKRNAAIKDLLIKVKKTDILDLTNIDFLENGLGGLLDYLTKNREFKNINKEYVENGVPLIQERELKISFNKSGGTAKNGITPRLTIPISWIKELGITEENRAVVAILEDGKIIIKPKKI